jgi:hypothetical protein
MTSVAMSVSTPKSPSRMDELLAHLSKRIGELDYAVLQTEAAADRLDGGQVPITSINSGASVKASEPAPRLALLGSLEDLSDRVERLTGRLSAANNRLSAAA